MPKKDKYIITAADDLLKRSMGIQRDESLGNSLDSEKHIIATHRKKADNSIRKMPKLEKSGWWAAILSAIIAFIGLIFLIIQFFKK
ncbi:hypothetical protein [Mucilaginibacter gossypii]|uniref:Uncharacterized protein n=1 Tax=Mucilaginibacter gossypii TaxID=551996 RepID=A0A1G7XJT1_9SPHI|nr:hypothetical protein [Mucilaginibacter gossypii]SDG84311.1 hypothetical protein SAMN05192573_10582 [Mucilaginibacter gossypii]